ncbi:MAG: hypothetical protein AAFX55_06815, partial [Bacteroidota bacterium]
MSFLRRQESLCIKWNTLVLLLVFCFSCKNEEHETSLKTEAKEEESVAPNYDFSTIPKDTIIVSGKEIVFFLPSKEELEIIKNEHENFKKDSLYKYQIPRIKKYLRFPKNIKISTSSKRIIGVDEGDRIRYYDRLDYFKSNFGMLMMYNRTFNFVKGFKNEGELYAIIDKYYRDNIRLEKTIDHKYVTARNGLNIRDEAGNVSDKYDYGDIVKIIGYTKDSIEIRDNGKVMKDAWAIIKWQQNGTTKKRYVFNGYLGEIKDIQVFKDQICYGITLEHQRLYDIPDDTYPECLDAYFGFKLISNNTFNSIVGVNTDFYKENKAVKITKNEDQTVNVSLPLKDSTLVYNSKMDYKSSSHSFYGDIDFLNQYLMFHIYYEAEEAFYSLIDKTSGKETFMFSGFPNISPDKKRILSFHYDIYEDEFYLQVLRINTDKTISFENLEYVFCQVKYLENP